MALVLLQLRLTISRRARGSGQRAQLYLATSWVLGGVGGLLSGTVVAALVSAGDAVGLLVLLGLTAISLAWVVGPIVEPTLADGVVDPERLEQFPLTRSQQVSGLLLGALVSPTATFTFLTAAGAAFARGEAPAARLASLAVAVAFTVMCVSVSRAAQTLLASALRSRRGADIAAIAASLLVLGIYLFAQQARTATAVLGAESIDGPIGTALGWTPPGAAGLALVLARSGDGVGFTVRLALILATIGLALLAWGWALGRRTSGVSSGRRAVHGTRVRSALPLAPGLLRRLPSSEGGAAAAQQLRYFFFRSPRAIQTLIIPPVMGVVVAHTSFAEYGLVAQSAAFAAMSVVSGGFNLFGYDGPGFGYLLLGGAPLPRVLTGKAMAPLVYLLPLVVGFNLVESSTQGTSGDILPAILAGFAVVGLGVGVGSLSSVLNPSDQSRVGQRHGSFLKVFGWFMGFFSVVGVAGVAWWVLSGLIQPALTGLAMLGLSVLAAWTMLRWSGRRLVRDQFAVLAKLEHL